jgi:transcriptional regulator with XRE-family HTH domain
MSDTEIRKAFGKRLKMLRKQKGLTQKELAAKLDIGFSQFNKYECGIHIPPAEKLIELSRILNVSLDYLLTGNEIDTSMHNLRLIERMQKLQDFQEKDIEAILNVMDAMILKHKVQGEIRAFES